MKYCFLRFPEGKFKAVTFSYDDGCRSDIHLAQILQNHHIKSTFNISSGLLGKSSNDWYLTSDEIKQYIINLGHEVAVHGAFHKAPGICRSAEYVKDVYECRMELEKQFECIIRGMAYPDCGITKMSHNNTYEQIKENLKNLGIVYSRTLGGDNDKFALPNDWYAWMPTAHHTNPEVLNYAKKFVDLKPDAYCSNQDAKLFYLWGHSYEFERSNNWELMENICDVLGDNDDIWYATNIELYDYVSAYENLIFSLDGNIIYNPSLQTVWILVDNKSYSIKPNEKIIIK